MPRRRASWYRSALTDRSSPPRQRGVIDRPRRAATIARATVSRELSNDQTRNEEQREDHHQRLHLTVKMPSSRLREVTSIATKDVAPVASTRSTRNIKKSYVVETSSEDEEEEEEEEEQEDFADEDDIAEETRPNAYEEGEEEDDDEAEIDADGDVEMGDDADDGVPLGHHPPPPILKVNPPAAPKGKPIITMKATPNPTKLKSVEAKEMSNGADDDDDDEELSELGSDDEEEEEEEDADDDDDDAEAEEDAEGEEMENDEDDEGDDSRSPDLLSRGTTPDINKMTKRQRSRLNEVYTASTSPTGGGSAFLELPMEPQIKKHLTAEEHAMRRAEMARRRKNLSEKRNEEEKQDTINRLLKKQAPKRRGKISAKEIEAQDRGDMSEAEELQLQQGYEEAAEVVPANPVFVRWVSDSRGCRVGVPAEWEGTPMGEVFVSGNNTGANVRGKMVEEVEG